LHETLVGSKEATYGKASDAISFGFLGGIPASFLREREL
jgi:hypothetical protein